MHGMSEWMLLLLLLLLLPPPGGVCEVCCKCHRDAH
jgi:hypothetical protein